MVIQEPVKENSKLSNKKILIIVIVIISLIAIIISAVSAFIISKNLNYSNNIKSELTDVNIAEYSSNGFVQILENSNTSILNKSKNYEDDAKIKVKDDMYLNLSIKKEASDYGKSKEEPNIQYDSFLIEGKLENETNKDLIFYDLYISLDDGVNWVWIEPIYFCNDSSIDEHEETFMSDYLYTFNNILRDQLSAASNESQITMKLENQEKNDVITVSAPAVIISELNAKYDQGEITYHHTNNDDKMISDKKNTFNEFLRTNSVYIDESIYEKTGENEYKRINFKIRNSENDDSSFTVKITSDDRENKIITPIILTITKEDGSKITSEASIDSDNNVIAKFDYTFWQIANINYDKGYSLIKISTTPITEGGDGVEFFLNSIDDMHN